MVLFLPCLLQVHLSFRDSLIELDEVDGPVGIAIDSDSVCSDARRKQGVVQHGLDHPSHKGCTVELRHFFGDGDEGVDHGVVVVDHILILMVPRPFQCVRRATKQALPKGRVDVLQDAEDARLPLRVPLVAQRVELKAPVADAVPKAAQLALQLCNLGRALLGIPHHLAKEEGKGRLRRRVRAAGPVEVAVVDVAALGIGGGGRCNGLGAVGGQQRHRLQGAEGREQLLRLLLLAAPVAFRHQCHWMGQLLVVIA